MLPATLNPVAITAGLWRQRYLIGQLTRRDVLLKYRGSVLGIGWSFLYPLLLLGAFTLVFGGVFGGRWGNTTNSSNGFELALFIYCGLLVFMPFSEVITASPRLLVTNQNFVKKIIFPTEILPLVSVFSASLHAIAHLLILLAFAWATGHAGPMALLTPLALLPAWLLTLGLAWMLAAAGAYLRDLAHGMPVLAQLLMFLLPVFYPLSASPDLLRQVHAWNPLALAIEDVRRVVLTGAQPDWTNWGISVAGSLLVAMAGHAFYQRCREEFADVL